MDIALLAGGTGGAKLAVGLRDVLHGFEGKGPLKAGQLSVLANTADDIEIYGVHVSPDPDLITFRLAGMLGAAGFGIEGEAHSRMDALRAAGEDVWFELGDEDLAVCARRAELLAGGRRLTEAHAEATSSYDTGGARVLPMCDEPVRSEIVTPEATFGIQQFLIQQQSEPEIEDVRFAGVEQAQITEEVAKAIETAGLIIVGPSNPVISVSPILSVPGVSDALRAARAPVLAISPFVGGEVLKGPTAKFLEAAGHPASSRGAADFYAERHPGVIDAWVSDDPVYGHQHHLHAVDFPDGQTTRKTTIEILRYGRSLAPTGSAT